MDPEAYHGIVEYFGANQGGYKCGYCKGTKPDRADAGLWAHRLTTLEYQWMIDRGWRRSGKYCYKPILEKSCCPQYAIRCDAINFNLTKSQKRIIQRVNRFLATGEKKASHDLNEINCGGGGGGDDAAKTSRPISPPAVSSAIKKVCDSLEMQRKSDQKAEEIGVLVVQKEAGDQRMTPNKSQKAKQKRIQRRLEKIMAKETCNKEAAQVLMSERRKVKRGVQKKSLEERICLKDGGNPKHKLEIRFVATSSKEYETTFEISHKVYQKYQISIHKDDLDECTPKQYKRFLVDNPFQLHRFHGGIKGDDTPKQYGSYHMQYWLDDQIIAVGVIDILPNCISSVYLYYDPDYAFLSLGTYSALMEVQLVQRLNRINSGIKYYYMGFYIHSCKKMSYKKKIKPCYLLCPEVYTWHPIEQCLPKLDAAEYSRLDEDIDKVDEEALHISDTGILILHEGEVMTYAMYRGMAGNDDEETVREYSAFIGKKCSGHILLYKN